MSQDKEKNIKQNSLEQEKAREEFTTFIAQMIEKYQYSFVKQK